MASARRLAGVYPGALVWAIIAANLAACDGLHGLRLSTDPECDLSMAAKQLPSDQRHEQWYADIAALGERSDMRYERTAYHAILRLYRPDDDAPFGPVIEVRPAGHGCALLEVSQFGPWSKTSELKALQDSLMVITRRHFPDAVVVKDY